MKSLAAILVELNKPLVLEDIEISPLRFGQVLVQVHCSGICGAQIGEISGAKGPDKFLPHLLGHEGTATVLEVGEGVKKVKAGDKVVMHWRKGAGIDSPTPLYTSKLGKVNAGWVTTFNEYAVVSENRVTPISPEIPFDVAALMGCAVTTALGLINNLAQLKIGQSIAILGCGGVGLNVVQGAAMVSANPIIAIDIYDQKLKMAEQFGATHTINSARSDIREEVRKIVGPQGVDVFVENTGLVRLIEAAYDLTGNKGRTICVGVPRHDQNVNIHTMALHHGKVLTGCEGGDTDPTVDIPRYLRLFQRNKLELDKVITHRFPFQQINTALDLMRTGEVGRCILNMGP